MKLPSLPPLPGDRYLAATDQTPRRRHVVLWGVCCFSSLYAIFRQICLGVMRFFVYLQTIMGIAIVCYPEFIIIKKLYVL